MLHCSWALWPLLDRAGACPALATPELQCAIANLHRETYGDVYAAFGWGEDPTGLTGEQMREAAEGACASNAVSVGNMDYLMGRGEVRAKVEEGSPGELLLDALSRLEGDFQISKSEYALTPVPPQSLLLKPDGSPPLDTSNLLDWKRTARPRAQSLRRAPSDTSGLLRTALAGSMASTTRAPHNQLRRAASTESFTPTQSFAHTESFKATWSFTPRAPESIAMRPRPLQRTDSMQSTDTEVASPVLRAKPLGPSGSTLGISGLTLRRTDSMHMDGMQRSDSMHMDGMQDTPTTSIQDTPTTSMQSVHPQAPARRAKPLGPSGTTFAMTAPFSTLSLGRSDAGMSIGSPGFTFSDNRRAYMYPVVGQNLQAPQAQQQGTQQQDQPQPRRTGKPLTRVTYPAPPLEYVSAPRDHAPQQRFDFAQGSRSVEMVDEPSQFYGQSVPSQPTVVHSQHAVSPAVPSLRAASLGSRADQRLRGLGRPRAATHCRRTPPWMWT